MRTDLKKWVEEESNFRNRFFRPGHCHYATDPRAPGENRTQLSDVGNVVCDQYTTGAKWDRADSNCDRPR